MGLVGYTAGLAAAGAGDPSRKTERPAPSTNPRLWAALAAHASALRGLIGPCPLPSPDGNGDRQALATCAAEIANQAIAR